MKFSKKLRNWSIGIGIPVVVGIVFFTVLNDTTENFPVSKYYGYDTAVPLKDSVYTVRHTDNFEEISITYHSIHDKKVTGLLSLPKNTTGPLPVVILMHGLGDHKAVDYVAFGNDLFLKNDYAVLRLDISDHGDRKSDVYDFDLTGKYKYWTRDVISQTVFDLRRAVDFIETRKELDANRIGYYGISLGGIIGTIFCGVENRVKVPIIALAGGQLNLLYEEQALSQDAKDFVSVIEPLNFVKSIAPRPFLMLNAKNDEIIPPLMSKLLFNKAEAPKDIIWYDAKHRDAPLETIYGDGLNWFNKHL
ncbi:acetylxylan esterase [uncultured Kriegella sp.]|uniref:alpha/beta hydrolase n=1 Tax=uncultured Kriegella sp. TaxID=1798910 RepID=UPI0030DB703A|tara:strand:- start:16031 stop:16945 length:915 start_codon:yes stop_codon:yes gene_type:complete